MIDGLKIMLMVFFISIKTAQLTIVLTLVKARSFLMPQAKNKLQVAMEQKEF